MELLEKFASVEVKADTRITEVDKQFCESNQAAYESAIACFRELDFFWSDMENQQKELLGGYKDTLHHDYLVSNNGPKISHTSINRHIESLHTSFICTLTHYFNTSYHVSVSSTDIAEALLPKEPDRWKDKKAFEEYHAKMQEIAVRYEDVVDQLILRLDGRSFSEQAFFELSNKCHGAAWNSYSHEAKFEQKKDTIRFNGYFCKYECWGRDRWSLENGMQDILRGAAHFETGSYNIFPLGFSDLMGYGDTENDVVTFPTSEKLRQLRMFKNHRVDLKFSSAAFAEEFAAKYLGTVC